MKLFIVAVVLLIQYSMAKETVVYEATGGDLFDLIRGIPPKDGRLQLTKVEGTDRESLPDGIYFIPEDEALTNETPYLYVNKNAKKTDDIDKKPVFTAAAEETDGH